MEISLLKSDLLNQIIELLPCAQEWKVSHFQITDLRPLMPLATCCHDLQ